MTIHAGSYLPAMFRSDPQVGLTEESIHQAENAAIKASQEVDRINRERRLARGGEDFTAELFQLEARFEAIGSVHSAEQWAESRNRELQAAVTEVEERLERLRAALNSQSYHFMGGTLKKKIERLEFVLPDLIHKRDSAKIAGEQAVRAAREFDRLEFPRLIELRRRAREQEQLKAEVKAIR